MPPHGTRTLVLAAASLCCCLSYSEPQNVPAKTLTVRYPPPSLKLDQVVHAIGKLYLVSFDFAFDGGSLVFAFGAHPTAGKDDAKAWLFLPKPKTRTSQQHAWDGKHPQLVIASPRLQRVPYALVAKTDPGHAAFTRLIRDAGIRQPDEHTSAKELENALEIVKNAVLRGQSPVRWGPDAFPETYGQDAVDTATDDDPFGDF